MSDDTDAKQLVDRINKVWKDQAAAERERLQAVEEACRPIVNWLDAVRKEFEASGKHASLSFSGWEKLAGGRLQAEIALSSEGRDGAISICTTEKNQFDIEGQIYALPDDLDRAKARIGDLLIEILT
jgi:hypothetical protein